MTRGMEMMGTFKLRAMTAYRHTVYQTISITIPKYQIILSIHPMIPYNGFIWQEETFANFMFLWRIVKVLSTNAIQNWFQTLWHPRTPTVTRIPYRVLMTALFAYFRCTDQSQLVLYRRQHLLYHPAGNKNGTHTRRYGRGKECYADLQAWGIRLLHSQREGTDVLITSIMDWKWTNNLKLWTPFFKHMLKCGQCPWEVCVWHILKNMQGDARGIGNTTNN